MKRNAHPRLKTLVAAVALSLAWDAYGQALPTTFTVSNTNDSGTGSLRQAIIDAGTFCVSTPLSIVFAVGSGPVTIAPVSQLEPMPSTCAVTIDGTTQPPGGPGQRVFLSGANAGPTAVGLRGFAGGSLVTGLAIGNFGGGGVDLGFGSGSAAYGNFIGLDPDGVTRRPNGVFGIRSSGSVTAIGGAGTNRNVISGNNGPGLDIPGGGSVTIANNLIGLAADGVSGSLALTGNSGDGINVASTVFGNVTVGGAGAGNRIAFNGGNGVNNGAPFSCTNMLVSQNDIFSNAALGIDRSGTPPVQTVGPITYTATDSTIPWSGSGFFANQSVTVEFFSNDDPLLGIDEGQRYLGSCGPVIATGGVVASCPLTVPGIARNVTTTVPLAFPTTGGTSEFSSPTLEPDMKAAPTSLTFPATALGTSSAPVVLNINNPSGPGATSLTIDSIVNPSASEFFDTTGGGPGTPAGAGAPYCGLGSDLSGAPLTGASTTIAPGGSCTLNMAFRPQASGTRSGAMTFNDAFSPGFTVTVPMTGQGGTLTALPVTATFTPTSLALPGPVPTFSTLNFKVDNPNLAPATGLLLTHTLPANLVIAPTPPASVTGASCSGSFVSATPGASSFTVDSLAVPTSGSCDLNIPVTSSLPGTYSTTVAAGAMLNGTVLSQAVSNALSNTASLAVNAATLLLSPPSPLNFGTVSLGSSSPVPVTLTNTGGVPLDFSASFAVAGANAADFSFTDTCVPDPLPQLAPGASCTVNVTFTPQAIGARVASMSFASNTLTTTDVLNFTGTGSPTPVPVVSLAPTGLTFPPQTVGTTSSPQVATLSNIGTAPLNISSIATLGDFAQSSTCGTTLAQSASCTISVTFTPIITGLRTGDVKVFDDASGSPHIVALDGTGLAVPVPTLTAPASVSFPTTQVGGSSSAIDITIGNSGGAPLAISAAEVVGAGFARIVDGCSGALLPPSGSCVVSIVFAPTTSGALTATLRILSNAPTSPNFVGLTGQATVAPVASLSASPASLTFVQQVIGTTSPAQAVTLSNTGGLTATISGISVTGDYAQTNNCSTVPAAGSCTINVTFTPTATGARPGSIVVASDASSTPFTIALSGSSAPPPLPVLSLSVSSLSYGNTMIGRGSGTQAVTLRNTGGAPLTIGTILATGEYVVTNGCPTVVPAGESCRIDLGFRPSIPGPRTGRLEVTSNASNGTQGVDLAGTGCRISILSRNPTLICQ